jgi:hypothetical protein
VLDIGLAAIDAGQAPVRLVPLGQQDADGKPVWVYFIERGDGSEGCPVGFCDNRTGEPQEFMPMDEIRLSIDGGHCGDCRAEEEAAAAGSASRESAEPLAAAGQAALVAVDPAPAGPPGEPAAGQPEPVADGPAAPGQAGDIGEWQASQDGSAWRAEQDRLWKILSRPGETTAEKIEAIGEYLGNQADLDERFGLPRRSAESIVAGIERARESGRPPATQAQLDAFLARHSDMAPVAADEPRPGEPVTAAEPAETAVPYAMLRGLKLDLG